MYDVDLNGNHEIDVDIEYPTLQIGGSGDSVFVATYGQTTLSEIVAAYNAKKSVICNYGNRQYGLYSATETIAIFNTTDVAGGQIQYRLSVNAQNAWSVANADMSETLIVTADFNATTMEISNVSHTFAEIAAAYDAKKIVILRAGLYEFEATAKASTVVQFTAPAGENTYTAIVRNTGVWTANKVEMVTEITDSATNFQYPSALATKNYVDGIVGGIETLLANI